MENNANVQDIEECCCLYCIRWIPSVISRPTWATLLKSPSQQAKTRGRLQAWGYPGLPSWFPVTQQYSSLKSSLRSRVTLARASQGVMWPVFSFCFCGVFRLTIPALLWNGFHICQMETIHLVEFPFLESGDPPGDGNGPGLKGLRSPSSHSIKPLLSATVSGSEWDRTTAEVRNCCGNVWGWSVEDVTEGPCWLGDWESGRTPNKGYLCADSGRRRRLGGGMREESIFLR